MNFIHVTRALRYGLWWSAVMLDGFLSANRNEEKVAPYTLPDPLQVSQETRMSDSEMWENKRRTLLDLFSEHLYGAIPESSPEINFKLDTSVSALNGIASKKEITLFLTSDTKGPNAHLVLFTPSGKGPYPVILGYNLEGNHTVLRDASISRYAVWSKKISGCSFIPSEGTRGKREERWPVEDILSRGYALATLYYGDVEPDYPNASSGIRAVFPEFQKQEDNFSAIGAWAWGLSRVMDYLSTNADIDATRVSLFGFSRVGKAVLLAAARDRRFAGVIAVSSGKGGAALSRRTFGETLRAMTTKYPHWFSKKFASYAGRENELPVDQHELLALIAPRPVLVSSADKDWWSDPTGEKEAVDAARKVYALYKKENNLKHVLHHGKHEVTRDKWNDYFAFLGKNL